jgi:hypothetical protein
MALFSAFIQIFAFYFAMTVSYLGWGRATRAALKVGELRSDSRAADIWIGWAATLAASQFVHLFRPLGALESIIIFLPGLVFFLRYRIGPDVWRPRRVEIPQAICAAIFVASAVWIAARSMQTPLEYDAGMYHFDAVRWINSFQIVPGLGNLHGRLAFNCSFFCYVASLNFFPYLGHGHSIANGYLFLVLLGQILARLCPAIANPGALTENRGLSRAGDLLVLPLLGYLAMTSLGFASPSPDLASTIIQIAIFLILLHGLGEWAEAAGNQEGRIFTLMFLAVTAVTIKMSGMGFAAGVLGLCIAQAVWGSKGPSPGTGREQGTAPSRDEAIKNACVASIGVLGIWVVRGYILSGYPFYPSPLGRIPFN